MKMKYFLIIVLLSATLSGQIRQKSIVKKIFTDKSAYIYGESIVITIYAKNAASSPDTIVFGCSIEAEPYIDGISFTDMFGLGCYPATVKKILMPFDSIQWMWSIPYKNKPGQYLPNGLHKLYGYFGKYYSNSDTITISVSGGPAKVERENFLSDFLLAQNYPNPFNPATVIHYSIASPGNVTLKVYDPLGREVAVLVREHQERGEYSVHFDAAQYLNGAGRMMSSGVYFYTLSAGYNTVVKKMTLLK